MKNPESFDPNYDKNVDGDTHINFVKCLRDCNIIRLLCREMIRDETIKSTLRNKQIDSTSLFVEFQRKLTADENFLIALQNRSDKLNQIFDGLETDKEYPAFLDEPGHKEKYYCGICLSKYFVKKAQNNGTWLLYLMDRWLPGFLALIIGGSLNCAFYKLDLLLMNYLSRTVPLKTYQKLSVYAGLYLAFLWWIVFSCFMKNVKKLRVKGEVL